MPAGIYGSLLSMAEVAAVMVIQMGREWEEEEEEEGGGGEERKEGEEEIAGSDMVGRINICPRNT